MKIPRSEISRVVQPVLSCHILHTDPSCDDLYWYDGHYVLKDIQICIYIYTLSFFMSDQKLKNMKRPRELPSDIFSFYTKQTKTSSLPYLKM